MLIIPIRTESEIRTTPTVNLVLIGINVLMFGVFSQPALARTFGLQVDMLALHSHAPAMYEFVTYQFLHADIWHLLGNMLFLWVFGNSVNAKMGDFAYLLFFIGGGVFAACGYVWVTPGYSQLIGASGSIAAVTTAYLALFPRSRVTVLVWFFFIYLFQLQATVIIVVKIIVWDNLVAPTIGGFTQGEDAIAQSAHLAGYLFGFVVAMGMLLIRALPRDQFDMLALWKRWSQRRAFARAMSDPAARARAEFGTVARTDRPDAARLAREEAALDTITQLRSRISEAVEAGSTFEACRLYDQLLEIDENQCLSERDQLRVAREYYGSGRLPQAVAAFERFLSSYGHSVEAANVRLLIGIVYARDLKQYEAADKHLSRCLEQLQDEARRTQCLAWLNNVRLLLGRPVPEA